MNTKELRDEAASYAAQSLSPSNREWYGRVVKALDEANKQIEESFINGGLWAIQWEAWNEEAPSCQLEAALHKRAIAYAADVLEA